MVLMNTNDLDFTKVQLLTIDENHEGQRIDNYLLTLLKGVPKSHIYRLCRKGEIRVNKKRIKPDYRLQDEDIVRLAPIKVPKAKPQAKASLGLSKTIESNIIFEDQYMMAVNKPSGLAVHGGSGVNLGLIETLRQIRPQEKFLELAHRLDRDTSGVVLIGKKRKALTFLHDAFRSKQVNKQYWCLVAGKWPAAIKMVDAPLLRSELANGERRVFVDQKGKSSQTKFRVLKHYKKFTWVEASPITGRTHQIRVHSACKQHPIIGDTKYCTDELNKLGKDHGVNRLFLHAASIKFPHPNSHEMMQLEAKIEPKLQAVLKNLPTE